MQLFRVLVTVNRSVELSEVAMQQAREGKKQLKFGKPSPVNFNLVVVGETGAGKTTFLKTLFKSYCDDEIINSELSQDAFITVKIESLDAFTMDTPSLDVNVHLYDFPGYGDCINNLNAIKTIKEYIENAHRSWFETSSGLMTEKVRFVAFDY